MHKEHELVAMVSAAKNDSIAADRLVTQYLPFIKSETAKSKMRIPTGSYEDALSIAMFAFHEAVLAYSKEKGGFLAFAAVAIRNRLIDFFRKEVRHQGHLSLHEEQDEDDRPLIETLDTGVDAIAELQLQSATKEEITEFAFVLGNYQLSLTDVADNCPKQGRTLAACHKVLRYIKENPCLIDVVVETGKLPMNQLVSGTGVERKTLERHRKYLLAIILAYTNGFEIIRGHLCQMSGGKGEQSV